MTTLENYFGIRFIIYKELNPFSINQLQEKAKDIANLIGFNVEDFFVYIHTISVLKRQSHFSKNILLKDKLDNLEVEFSANPTQIRKEQVKFYNCYVDYIIEEGINEAYCENSLSRIYKGEVLENNNWLETTLITYIKKDLKKKFRKIKINVKANPTEKYKNILERKNGVFLTQVDLNLDQHIKLNLKNLKPDEIETIRKTLQKNLKEKKMEETKENKQFQNSPTINADYVVANFGAGEKVEQLQENISIKNQNQIYEELRKMGIDNSDIIDLQSLVKKKDNVPIHKKIFNWVGKVTQKAIEKGIEMQVPLLMEKLKDLI